MAMNFPANRRSPNRTAPVPARSGRPATVIDLASDSQPAPPESPQLRRDADDSDAHLLRLCLDLQLDAMLLTLGAASAETTNPVQGAVPWRRWVNEDVDLACTLAADALTGHAALPPTLGSDLHHVVPATTIDNLVARFESMRDLLADLVGAAGEEPAPLATGTAEMAPGSAGTDATGTAPGGSGRTGSGQAWRPRVQEALDQCERRLAELYEYRLMTTPARGIRLPGEHQFLPGELLG